MVSYGSARRGPDWTRMAQGKPMQAGTGVTRLRILLASPLMLSCAGCMVGPDFASPTAPVADKWLEANHPSVDTGNQQYRDWWTVFHDPVLNRLVETAYNQNLTLVSAGTRVLQARAELGVAIGEFYPASAAGERLGHLYPAEPC